MTSPDRSCALCGDGRVVLVVDVPDVPVFCNVLWPNRHDAVHATRGDIRLGFCQTCGALRNTAFDPAKVDYSRDYENSLHYSPAFQAYAHELARRLVERYALEGRTVLEIGCGKGEFLSVLCQAAGGNGIGYDPSYDGEVDGKAAEAGIRFVPRYYPTSPEELDADFVCCRHVLEHLNDPRALVEGVRRAIGGRDVPSYVEVPDAGYMLREAAVWDLIYEHPWHFSAASLRRLFASSGYRLVDVGSSFGGQYLFLEALPAPAPNAVDVSDEVAGLGEVAARFGKAFREITFAWGRELSTRLDNGERVALWGAGSKGVTFLNLVAGGDRVEAVVDVNPRKHGRHVPGTGQAVVGPAALAELRPDLVLTMNPLYEREIAADLERMGVRAATLSVGKLPAGMS